MLLGNVATAGEIFREVFRACIEIYFTYFRCRDVVQLLKFLLSTYSLIGIFYSVQNCTFRLFLRSRFPKV
jgi:hypothetical protein